MGQRRCKMRLSRNDNAINRSTESEHSCTLELDIKVFPLCPVTAVVRREAACSRPIGVANPLRGPQLSQSAHASIREEMSSARLIVGT